MAQVEDAKTPEVHESIEAKGGAEEDVDMAEAVDHVDADADADMDAEGDDDPDADADADGEPDDSQITASGRLPRKMLDLIETTSKYLCEAEEDGEEIAAGFQRIPNKRLLPDYFDVIKEPIAFSTIRGKVNRRLYNGFAEFVRDVALICHNAQVYNRPSAPIFRAAEHLRQILKKRLQELVAEGTIQPHETVLPDLGELPPVEDSPPAEEGEEEDEEADEDEDDEDEDEDDEDSDEEGGGRRFRRRRGRPSRRGRDDDAEDAHKKRGRPPKVYTPMEARIHSLLKGLRKFRRDDGQLRVLPFERLPDKAALPDYYATIRNPIALDLIKKKAKRKKYQSVDQVLADLELMVRNAKEYNEEDSAVFEDAVALQAEARLLAEQEKARPDNDFRDEDGKLPLESFEHNGETWRVGDWVHIRNANDLRKPIVAQIYRAWQDALGQKWVNACWYYRPEQTVHRYEKHFYHNEVVKTGQYRDHRIEEIVDRCFVMFITRYHRGRPRGLPKDKEVYVCEARYNEEKFRLNKIKTWASCVPDEVREKDYEMELFPVPHKLKKYPSPIKHLLRADAKETDELPKPTWGSPNAPPIVGAVHRRPRAPNESPPPEPTPPPPPAPAPAPQLHQDPSRRISSLGSGIMSGSPAYASHTGAALVPGAPSSNASYNAHFAPPRPMPSATPSAAPHLQPMPPMAPTPVAPTMTQAHGNYAPQPYAQQHNLANASHPHTAAAPLAPYNNIAMTPARMHVAPTPNPGSIPHGNAQPYNPPNPPKVFTMPASVEEQIPAEVREQFHRDDQGRVLLFSSPPRPPPAPHGVVPDFIPPEHSARYLSQMQKVRAIREQKRQLREGREESLELNKLSMMAATMGIPGYIGTVGLTKDEVLDALIDTTAEYIGAVVRGIQRAHKAEMEDLDGWDEVKKEWDEERRQRQAAGENI